MHHSEGAPSWRRTVLVALAAVLALSVVGCTRPSAPDKKTGDSADKPSEIVLASTTSTQDSGLFDVLIPAFEEANPGYAVKVIAVGTGEALKLGETKDADVLLVHARADEEAFVRDGFGIERRDVMYNDFVIVGPADDPAGVKASADATAAMKALAAAGTAGTTVFISRGDESGTHKKELKLWSGSGVATPTPGAQDWYESTGQGMGETLKITSEKGGYTIADRATFLTMKDSLDVDIVREGDKGLLNQYGVIVVTDATNEAGGQVFFDWILSEQGQDVIGGFGVEEYGQQLFVPNAE